MIVPANQKILRFVPKSLLQQPFELLLGFMCIISGVQHFVQDSNNANALELILPHLIVDIWNAFLGVGGALVVLGIIRNQAYIERAGLSLLGPTSLIYAGILATYFGLRAFIIITILVAFGLACFLKDFTLKVATLSITRIFKEVRNDRA